MGSGLDRQIIFPLEFPRDKKTSTKRESSPHRHQWALSQQARSDPGLLTKPRCRCQEIAESSGKDHEPESDSFWTVGIPRWLENTAIIYGFQWITQASLIFLRDLRSCQVMSLCSVGSGRFEELVCGHAFSVPARHLMLKYIYIYIFPKFNHILITHTHIYIYKPYINHVFPICKAEF